MKRDIKVYIDDIFESINFIENYTKGLSESNFYKDTQVQDAVLRRLAIIGEAIKNMPKNFRDNNPEIQWKEIAGMRDILIHQYFGVRLERAWKTIKEDIPGFKKKLKKITISP